MAKKPTVVGLIGARAGSTRVPDKNIKPLAGHPLLAYTVRAAIDSGVFDAVVFSSDSARYAEIAEYYGAEVPFMRPPEFATTTSPDIEWVEYTLNRLRDMGRGYDCFSLLRPTSPFRRPETIKRAWEDFTAEVGVDSLRAVEKCGQHPCKMWVIRGKRMHPLIPLGPAEQPWHSSQYQSLPEVYIQNASLEIAYSRVVFTGRTIAGEVVMPFVTEGYEGWDVNFPRDWLIAEELYAENPEVLPRIDMPPIDLPEFA